MHSLSTTRTLFTSWITKSREDLESREYRKVRDENKSAQNARDLTSCPFDLFAVVCRRPAPLFFPESCHNSVEGDLAAPPCESPQINYQTLLTATPECPNPSDTITIKGVANPSAIIDLATSQGKTLRPLPLCFQVNFAKARREHTYV